MQQGLRILHLADAHLDTPFYGREAWMRKKLKEATHEAFRRAVTLAIDKQVHVFLMAGDLFDDSVLSFGTEQFLLNQMERLNQQSITVIYTTGNHDPGRRGARTWQLNWPKNVHLMTDAKPKTIKLWDSKGKLVGYATGAGHPSHQEGRNLVAQFPGADQDYPHIAVVHTQVSSAAGAANHDRYAPSQCEDFEDKGYDYWALGHIHTRGKACVNAPAWYPGNIQGRHPNETGRRGVFYAEIFKNAEPEPQFCPVAGVVWKQIALQLPNDNDHFDRLVDELAHQLKQKLSTEKEVANYQDHANLYLRIVLKGETPLASELRDSDNQNTLKTQLEEKAAIDWIELQIDTTVAPPLSLKEYADSPTILGEFLQLFEEVKDDPERAKPLLRQSMANSFSNDEEQRTYLADLLKGLDGAAAKQLLKNNKDG